MWTYVARRLLYAIPILAGVMFLTFIIFFAISSPRDLARVELGQGASEDRIAEWTLARGFASYNEEGLRKLDLLPEMEAQSERVAAVDEVIREHTRRLTALSLEIKQAEAAMPVEGEEPKPDDAPEPDPTQPESQLTALKARLDALPEVKTAEAKEAELKAAEAELKNIPDLLKAKDATDEAKAALKARQKLLTGLGEPGSGSILRLTQAATEARLTATNARIAFLESADAQVLPPDDAAQLLVFERLKAEKAQHERDKAAAEIKVTELREELKKLAITSADIVPHGPLKLFVTYIRDLVTFNFGESNQKRPVTEIISNGMWPSIKLMLPAFLITEFLAVALALFAALYRGTKIDRALVVFAVFLMSFSSIAIVMIVQKLVAADWGYFPISGYRPGPAGYAFLALPMLLYVIISVGPQLRFNRILMLDEIGQDYVRTAKAKGLGQNSILFKHVLRNSMIPLITRWAVVIPNLYLGSLILESFFGIPGLGGITVQAIANRDVNMIRALVFIGTLIYIASTLLADVLYAVVDPRVKLK